MKNRKLAYSTVGKALHLHAWSIYFHGKPFLRGSLVIIAVVAGNAFTTRCRIGWPSV